MEIDNSLVGLSMEFEKQNEVVSEWESEKARKKAKKRGSDSGNTSGVESEKGVVLFDYYLASIK